jgi:hypothetical protein
MSASRDKQLQLLKEAVVLIEANPTYEVHVCAVYDEFAPEYHWTNHQITKVEIQWWYTNRERIIVGLDEIRDHLECVEDRDVTEEEVKSKATQIIAIYTNP